MKKLDLLAPLAIGYCLGWFVTRFIAEFPSVPSGHILTSATALAIGWWVQRALRRRAELDRIPIEAVTKLSSRMGELVNQALDSAPNAKPTDSELLQRLRLISVEITWLGTLVKSLGAGAKEHAQLQQHYLRFKEGLTLGSTIDLGAAGRFGMQMRMKCLQIQLQICQRILDDPNVISGLSGEHS